MTTHFSQTQLPRHSQRRNCRQWFCIRQSIRSLTPLVGANRSNAMKETKILVATLIAGFVLHQSALCQTNTPGASPADAGVTATNPPASDAAGGGGPPPPPPPRPQPPAPA